MKKKLFLYGAGKRCRDLCKILQQSDYEIIAILDSNPDTWGKVIEGCCIEAPDIINSLKEVEACITVADINARQAIRKTLQQKYQYDLTREVNYNSLILEVYRNDVNIRKVMQNQDIPPDCKENVLFDCYNGLGLGGVEAWTKDICSALIKSGQNNIYIISDQGSYAVSDDLINHILKVGINHDERFSRATILNLVKTIISKLPCKVVTCTTNEVMLAAYLVKCYYPDLITVISVIHNSNESVYENYLDFKECSDFYIGVSLDILDDMINRGVKPDRITSMTCPFACERELERKYTEDITQPVRLGYAGRMEYSQKRMDLLLKCVELLEEKKVCFRLEVAGDGIARKEMETFINKKHLKRKVKFLGKLTREEMSSFWKQQDICVNFSDFEGRCISIIEAMGNGAVPIVTATSGVKEDILDGENGYIVPIGDYRAIAERVEYLSYNREALQIMGAMAHKAVYPKSMMEEHLNFWNKILNF